MILLDHFEEQRDFSSINFSHGLLIGFEERFHLVRIHLLEPFRQFEKREEPLLGRGGGGRGTM